MQLKLSCISTFEFQCEFCRDAIQILVAFQLDKIRACELQLELCRECTTQLKILLQHAKMQLLTLQIFQLEFCRDTINEFDFSCLYAKSAKQMCICNMQIMQNTESKHSGWNSQAQVQLKLSCIWACEVDSAEEVASGLHAVECAGHDDNPKLPGQHWSCIWACEGQRKYYVKTFTTQRKTKCAFACKYSKHRIETFTLNVASWGAAEFAFEHAKLVANFVFAIWCSELKTCKSPAGFEPGLQLDKIRS